VLKLHRQHYYAWLAGPVTDAEWSQAHRANAIFDAHRDDPEFGYRFLAGEARQAGQALAERTAWRICADNGWWSRFGKKSATPRPPAPARLPMVIAIVSWIERTYHRRRRESTLGRLTPIDYELTMTQTATQAA
jgi:putative transposase